MKTQLAVVCGILISALALSGCGPARTDGDAAKASAPAVSAEATSAPGTPEAPREITITVGDSMKFDRVRLEAAAGETLRVVLVNAGVAPKEAMGHNWVLLAAGADATAFANSAVKAKETDYVPTERASEVLAHTKLLGGGARDAVVFTVPTTAGDYVYLCTFPAHFQLGMTGVLTVK